MADIGIRRPVEFGEVFKNIKAYGIADRFTEIVVLAAYAGYHFDRTGDGPFENPVEWPYFTSEEKNRLYVLGIADSIKPGGQADPEIVSDERLTELFRVLERYVHGGLLEMRDQGVFQSLGKEGYGHGIAGFVLKALQATPPEETLKVEELLRDLKELGSR